MSAVSPLANVDWPTVAAAIGTLIGSLWLTIKGLQKGRAKVESGQSSITSIVGGTIMDNQTMRDLTSALQENSDELRANTAQLQRHNDFVLLIGRLPGDKS